jgi:hypothetical protein
MEEPKIKATMSDEFDHEKPRIEPIEDPDSFKLKLAYWFTKKKIGKVITPLKVIQSRMPGTLSLSKKMIDIEENLSLPDDLVFFIKSYVATLNGCSFCIDIAKAKAGDEATVRKYEQLLNYESADEFSYAEKAALKYVEQATLEKEVSDKIFKDLREHFSDSEIVEITWLNALENYYNLLSKPLGIESDNLCKV